MAGKGSGSHTCALCPLLSLRYDPMFMLPLLNHLLSASEVPVRTFVSCGALSIAVVALSSRVKAVRAMAYGAVAQYLELLAGDAEGFRERPQVELVLRVMQASVPAPFAQLPALLCLFVTEALEVSLKPTHPHYQVRRLIVAHAVHAGCCMGSDLTWYAPPLPRPAPRRSSTRSCSSARLWS